MKLAAALMSALLAGCILPPQVASTFEITAKFDAAAAASLMAPGKNTIRGNAFLRQQGGGVVTCAGAEVSLIPATAYATERMAALYGPLGNQSHVSRRSTKFIPDLAIYHTTKRHTRCDAQGNFVFEDVADGSFYVVTGVWWQVATPQGGNVMHPVTVQGGQAAALIMSR